MLRKALKSNPKGTKELYVVYLMTLRIIPAQHTAQRDLEFVDFVIRIGMIPM